MVDFSPTKRGETGLTMDSTTGAEDGFLEQVLQFGVGFSESDHQWVRESLAAVAPHLERWDPADVELHISVKPAGGKDLQVTLQADLPGFPALVARSEDQVVDRAVSAAKRELIRQIDDEKGRREPKDNRHLRTKTT